MTYPNTPERDIEQAVKLLVKAFQQISPYEAMPSVLVPAVAWPHFEFRVRKAVELMAKQVEIAPAAFSPVDKVVIGGIEFRRGQDDG